MCLPRSELTLNLSSGTLYCRIVLITEEKLGAKLCKEKFPIWVQYFHAKYSKLP